MSFKDMDKEKKQLVILAVGGAITLFFIVSNLVIGPAREDATEAEEIINELERDVRNGERLLRRSVMTEREVKSISSEIFSIYQKELPPRTSTYIWTVEKLSLLAEEADLSITVREHPNKRYVDIPPSLTDVSPDSVPFWIPYSVDLEVNTTFAKLKNFLTLLEESLPFASVAGLKIQSNAGTPEEHGVTLLLEWPIFRFQDDNDWISEEVNF